MITYRPVTWDDVDDIAEEFDRTWGSCAATGGSDISMLLSRHFTLHYLVPSTRGQVAQREDGAFLGVTLSRVVGQSVLFPDAQRELDRVDEALRASGLGAKALADTERWHRIEEEMEDAISINQSTQGEVELFLVASSARGHGVGGTLWREQMRFFADSGVSRYYLHTDTSCDVGFYDHHGLKRVAERLTREHPEDARERQSDGDMDDIFIYEGATDQI